MSFNYEPEGRVFESPRAHHRINNNSWNAALVNMREQPSRNLAAHHRTARPGASYPLSNGAAVLVYDQMAVEKARPDVAGNAEGSELSQRASDRDRLLRILSLKESETPVAYMILDVGFEGEGGKTVFDAGEGTLTNAQMQGD